MGGRHSYLRVSCRKSVAAVSLLRGGMRNSIEGCLVQSFYISETNIRRLRDSAGDARGLGVPVGGNLLSVDATGVR